MDCTHLRILLDRYIDREIDPDVSMSIARHLGACRDCSHTVAARSSIRSAIKKDAGYYRAGPALANRIRTQFAAATPQAEVRPRRQRLKLPEWGRLLALAGAFASVVLATSLATFQLASVRGDETLVAQLISSRSRSIVTGHGIDIASSDQHTVKPWLSSKLDFSPDATDLSAVGFPLRGGRLDYVNDRPVAVLVYGYGQHPIDLFIWPQDSAQDKALRHTVSKRGVNVLHWTAAGMTYWAVSDINKADLEEFAARYSGAA